VSLFFVISGFKIVTMLHDINVVRTTQTFSQARSNLTAASDGCCIFFGGGVTNNGWSTGGVDIYSTNTGVVTTSTLSQARSWLASTTCQERVFFAGGYDGTKFYDRVDIYKPKTSSWKTASLSRPRRGLAATSVQKLVLFGGGQTSNGLPSEIVDVYNMAEKRWSHKVLCQARAYLAATSVSNRYALFAGGWNGKEYVNNVDMGSSKNILNTTPKKMGRRHKMNVFSVLITVMLLACSSLDASW
jgi:hypothetical protein